MKLTRMIEEILNPEDSLGISRDEMPQIDSEHVGEFLEYLKNGRCEFEEVQLMARSLAPSQNELDTDKADDMYKDKECLKIPLFVSEDNYVLDGHHRWLAMDRNEPGGMLNCIRMKKPAKDCIEIMHGFEKTSIRDIEDEEVMETLAEKVLAEYADLEEKEYDVKYVLKTPPKYAEKYPDIWKEAFADYLARQGVDITKISKVDNIEWNEVVRIFNTLLGVKNRKRKPDFVRGQKNKDLKAEGVFNEGKSPSEVFNLPVIGTIETKELEVEWEDQNGKKEKVKYKSETYEVIHEDEHRYVCNEWYKEHKQIPQLIPKSQVKKFTKK